MLCLHCCMGFSLLQCQASHCSDFCCSSWALGAVHGLSCSTARGDQWSNPCLLHWHWDPLPLNHQGSPRIWLVPCLFYSLSHLLNLTCLKKRSRLPRWYRGKESSCQAGDADLIPGWGRSPGAGDGNSLHYSCLGNPMGRGPWWVTVHGVAKSQTRLSIHALGSEIPPHLPYFDRSKLLGTTHIWGEWIIQGPESQEVGITGGHLRGFLPQRS